MKPSRAKNLTAALLPWLASSCGDAHKEEEPETISVVVSKVEKATFTETLRSVGTCAPLPNLLATITPVVDGAVAEVLVVEGQEVKAGQPLVRLDDRLAVQDLAEKKSAKAELEASLALVKAPPREQDRRAAELEIERAKLAADLAQAVVTRLEPLNQRKEISEQQLFEARQKLADAAATGQTVKAKLELLIAGARPEAIVEAEAKVARADAALQAGAARLGYFTLSSPLQGTVDAIHCHPGQLLAPGTVAVEVVDTSTLIITSSVPATEASKVKPGQLAKVTTAEAGHDDEAKEAIDGHVASVGLQTNAATGAIPVRVLVANPAGKLRAGMVARVEITVGTAADALAVPDAAILTSEEEPTIAVVRDGKVVHLHPRVGLHHGGLAQISVEGLSVGELIVTRGAYDLPDGAAVKIEADHQKEEKEPAAEPEKKESSKP